ncbi:winged helix-turn-helix transcriptional regulator [Rhizobium sp. 16-449-1b]|uniref:MarR family winged helix-turn-helix transcriptional regulator n=1 Tax=Rhizobium sp. 16-449-1b TaxID=2819989 RepID=UPI001ADD11BF|nr:MarR family winged helix-turn-helix transcriptional regulator [Rhizobium sp. 16-449-1b]MBO9198449.1 winged helix-turn-helix transcriptional regulator [Rhizobium sp. 16-449-1b]
MKTPKNPHSVNFRILEGLSRVAAALRADEWERAKALGLNPTQLAILVLLEGRPHGLGVKMIAAHLGVSQPTATDSINALEKKGHVEKRAGLADGRSVDVHLSVKGAALLSQETAGDLISSAIAALGDAAQEELLVTLITIIRQLQEKNAIPVQRMCVTCRYFDPFAHPQSDKPHHCHFVHAPFGQRELRVDCREHELADPTSRAATWDAFEAG